MEYRESGVEYRRSKCQEYGIRKEYGKSKGKYEKSKREYGKSKEKNRESKECALYCLYRESDGEYGG